MAGAYGDAPQTIRASQAQPINAASTLAALAADPNQTTLTHIGEAAFATPGGQVYFVKKGMMVSVLVLYPTSNADTVRAWATALATAAAARL
jgi:hypothetical protein